jgi:hypothetical protein
MALDADLLEHDRLEIRACRKVVQKAPGTLRRDVIRWMGRARRPCE